MAKITTRILVEGIAGNIIQGGAGANLDAMMDQIENFLARPEGKAFARKLAKGLDPRTELIRGINRLTSPKGINVLPKGEAPVTKATKKVTKKATKKITKKTISKPAAKLAGIAVPPASLRASKVKTQNAKIIADAKAKAASNPTPENKKLVEAINKAEKKAPARKATKKKVIKAAPKVVALPAAVATGKAISPEAVRQKARKKGTTKKVTPAGPKVGTRANPRVIPSGSQPPRVIPLASPPTSGLVSKPAGVTGRTVPATPTISLGADPAGANIQGSRALARQGAGAGLGAGRGGPQIPLKNLKPPANPKGWGKWLGKIGRFGGPAMLGVAVFSLLSQIAGKRGQDELRAAMVSRGMGPFVRSAQRRQELEQFERSTRQVAGGVEAGARATQETEFNQLAQLLSEEDQSIIEEILGGAGV
jgi:hypothetical protein